MIISFFAYEFFSIFTNMLNSEAVKIWSILPFLYKGFRLVPTDFQSSRLVTYTHPLLYLMHEACYYGSDFFSKHCCSLSIFILYLYLKIS